MKYLSNSLLFVFLYCFATSCSSKAKTVESSIEPKESVIIKKENGIIVKNFQGYNAAIMPYYLEKNYDSLFPIIKAFSPKVLRFPGGTVANFYHPDKPGYGMNKETIDKMKNFSMGSLVANQNKKVKNGNITVNYKVPFARLCKDLKSSVLLVANLMDGTIEETLSLIEYFKVQNIEIVGVELGNEFYLNAYKSEFPTIEKYIKRSKQYAKAIRKVHPELKLAVVASPNEFTKEVSLKRTMFFNGWNSALAQENYYDAITIHHYVKSKGCFDNENINELFECSAQRVNTYADFTIDKIIAEHQKTFGKTRKIWMTEWNMRETSKYFGNTFLQATHALDFVLNLTRINAQNDLPLELSTYHNLCAGGTAFALVNPKNASEEQFVKRTAYYSLYMYQQIFNNKDLVYIPLNNDRFSKELDLGVFYSKSANELYILLANRTNQELLLPDLKMDKKALKNAVLNQMKAKGLMSGIGRVNYKKEPISGEIAISEKEVNLENWAVPAYTINKLTIDLSRK